MCGGRAGRDGVRAGGRACVNAGERAGEDGESADVREVCRRERG